MQLRIACLPYVAWKACLSAFFSAAHCFAARFFAWASLVAFPAVASGAAISMALSEAPTMMTIFLNFYLLASF
jgi:hypothetical protein